MKRRRYLISIMAVSVLSIILLVDNNKIKAATTPKQESSCVTSYEVLNEKGKTIAITGIKITGKKLVIPSKIDGYTVVSLGKVLPNMELFDTAGNWDDVTEIVLPNTLQRIGTMAFYRFKNLEKVNIPKSVVFISSLAFAETALKEIRFYNEKINLGDSAFSECMSLKKVVWPKKQMTGTIGMDCFAWTGLETLNFPNVKDYRQLDNRCFKGNKQLKTVYFPATKKLSIKYTVFTECRKAKLIIPKEVKEVNYRPSPYVYTMILQGKDTKFVELPPLMKNKKEVKEKYYLQLRTVIAPKGSAVFKQLAKCYYGIENEISNEYLYHGEDCSYNDGDMKRVKTKAVTLPSKPSVSCKSKTLSWTACSGAIKYEVYYSTSKNGTYQKVASTKSLRVSSLKKGFYKVCSVKTEQDVSWRSSYSKAVKVN